MLANQLMILVVKLLGCVHDVFTDGSRGPKSDLRIRADVEPLGKFIVCDKYKLCWRENRPLFYFLPTKRKRTAHETAFIYIWSNSNEGEANSYSKSAESKLISIGFPCSTWADSVVVRSSEYFCGISQSILASAILASVSSLMLLGAGALFGCFVMYAETRRRSLLIFQ